MSECLPHGELKWLNVKNVNKFDLNSICGNSSIVYTLEFDCEYPDELHELHNDYPLAPEKLEINHNMLSNYCSSIGNK